MKNLFKRLFRRFLMDDEAREEIEGHIAMRAELNREFGMSEDEAGFAARRQFGNATSIREEIYRINGFGCLEEVVQEVYVAARRLWRSPGFSLTAILIITVCIGTSGAVFSFVDAAFFKSLPYPDPSRIVRVEERRPSGESNVFVAPLNFLDWKNQNTVFQEIAARTYVRETLSGVGEPTDVLGTRVTASYFGLFGVTAASGRLFTPEDDQAGKGDVVVLSHQLWAEQFGSNPDIIGHSIVLDEKPYVVVGVLPRNAPIERDLARYWRPLTFSSEERTRGLHVFTVAARLKRDVTVGQARAEMNAIAAAIAKDHPDSNKGWGVIVDPYQDVMISASHFREALYLWSAAVGMLLLIGLANLVNLMLARVTARSREVAIQMALGAGRPRLIRELLAESLLTSITGGVAGVLLAYTIVFIFQAFLPEGTLPREMAITIDLRVLAVMCGLSIVTGMIVGITAAIRATCGDLLQKINRSGRTSTPALSRHRLGKALVITQVALSFAMLTISGLLVRSFVELMAVDAGFDEARMLTIWLTIPQRESASPVALITYLDEIVRSLARLPGVQNTAATAAPPLGGWGYSLAIQVDGDQATDAASRRIVGVKPVSPSYFDTVNIQVLRGRSFSNSDTHDSVHVAVIGAAMAKTFFNDKDPIGRHLLVPELVPGQLAVGRDISWEIVGVVSDERVSLFNPVSPGLYVPIQQSLPMYVNLVVRTRTPAAFLEKSVRKVIHEINRDQGISQLRTIEESRKLAVTTNRQQTVLLAAFTGVAVLLGAIGIYALISFLITQRTGEIGIRMALGSTPASIVKLVLGRVMSWTATGTILGIIATLGLTRVLRTFLFGISEHHVWLFLVAIAVFTCISAAAAWLPARRAARIDPMLALRAD